MEFVVNFAFGAFGPIFAIFITERIVGGNAEIVGFATAVFWIVKSIIQLPVARYVDRHHGERDDLAVLIAGYFLASFSILFYVFATTPLHIYLIQGFLGVTMAFSAPGWYGIFARHVDRAHESFEWSLVSVFSVGIATAISGAVGGVIVVRVGFDALFIGASALSFVGAAFLLLLLPYVRRAYRPKTLVHQQQAYPVYKAR